MLALRIRGVVYRRMGFENDGFAIVPDVLSAGECAALLAALGPSEVAGRRGLLALDAVAKLARSAPLMALIRPLLGAAPLAVRAIFFDKSPEVNWLVAWHQDLTIAVRKMCEVPGFGPWSVKDGIPHVQPPVALLERMLTVRIHLDDADESNGALRVLPGSHRHGRLTPDEVVELRGKTPEFLCAAKAGDALLMRPLILHASGRSMSAAHRRVLHIEYAAFALPGGLEWQEL